MIEEIDNGPKTPLEAAIDKATGFKPGDEAKGGKKADDRDWVKDAYECFVKNAVDMEPTDPVKAIAAYFEKNATDELKATAKAEGKTAEGCWNFIEAVARKALGGRSGHIDPVTVYAIAMHYFQDVPKDWYLGKKTKVQSEEYRSTNPKDVEAARRSQIIAHNKRKAAPEMKTDKVYAEKVKHDLDDLDKKYPVKKAKPKAKKGGKEQGFFFDLLETEPVGGTDIDGMEDGDAQ